MDPGHRMSLNNSYSCQYITVSSYLIFHLRRKSLGG